MERDIFLPADILLYRGDDPTDFSVVACDQYTSEPDYWARVRARAEGRPSAYHLVFPELYLKEPDFDERIASINAAMDACLRQGCFRECTGSLVYVERTLRGGKVRRGIVGKIDLEEYDYEKGSQSRIRATEGTVLERIPPRVRIRENAPLELPHVMLLADDRERTVIEPIATHRDRLELLYHFPLMEESGSLAGYLLPPEEQARIASALRALAERDAFEERYQIRGEGRSILQFAVGDGNHSLATARKCYLQLKEQLGEEAARRHPARYALVELVNLHDESLEFEAIHRVLFGVQPEKVLAALEEAFELLDAPFPGAQEITAITGSTERKLWIGNPTSQLAVGTLQAFIDEYLAAFGGEVDYIHGEDVVRSLCGRADSIGFLLPRMDKNDLFRTVILDGALPRKTFSMGEACDKRFYFEARRIR